MTRSTRRETEEAIDQRLAADARAELAAGAKPIPHDVVVREHAQRHAALSALGGK